MNTPKNTVINGSKAAARMREAAIDAFAENGCSGTTTRQIAARLGQELDSTSTIAWDVSVPLTANILVDSDTYEVITTNATQSYRAGLRLAVKRVT